MYYECDRRIVIVFDINKLAYCGLYCSQCSFVVAYETNNRDHLLSLPQRYDKFKQADLSEHGSCKGCKGENLCGDCEIKDCAVEKGIDCCADCKTFPCEIILIFANDGTPHHAEAFNNLNKIKADGKENWFDEYKTSLNCACGERLSWYYKCPVHN